MDMDNETVLAQAPVKIKVTVTPWTMECLACDASMFGSWWGVLRLDPNTQIIRAIVVDPNTDESWARFRITPEMVAKAIADMIENGWDTRYPQGALAEFAVTREFGSGYDSVVADAILQQAIFNEVVYG